VFFFFKNSVYKDSITDINRKPQFENGDFGTTPYNLENSQIVKND